jgi:hypothetical protein
MASLQEYSDAVNSGNAFLDNYDNALQSLLLSKQNANNRTYSEETQGIGNGTIQPSEGVEPGSSSEVA